MIDTAISSGSSSLAHVEIPRQEIAAMLRDLGVRLDTSLAESHMLAAFDTLAAINLASAIAPADLAGMSGALALLHTWTEPQPEPVRMTQQLLLQNAPAEVLGEDARKFLLAALEKAPVLGA